MHCHRMPTSQEFPSVALYRIAVMSQRHESWENFGERSQKVISLQVDKLWINVVLRVHIQK